MKNNEKDYLDQVSQVFLNFAKIQKDFTNGRDGIKAVLNFIDEMSRKKNTSFALDDPILIKGSDIMNNMIDKLEEQYKILKDIAAPESFAEFHSNLEKSLKLQLSGYKEMVNIFSDYKVTNVLKGGEKVDKGLELIGYNK